MILRYWLKNPDLGVAVEAPATPEGRTLLLDIRQRDKRFKRRQVRSILQGGPSAMPPFGTVFRLGMGSNGWET